MDPAHFLEELAAAQRFFATTTTCLQAGDAGFVPRPGMFSVAGQIAHVARTVDWFMDGAFVRNDGFDLDFAKHNAEAQAVTSLATAQAWIERAFAGAATVLTSNANRLHETLPLGIMGGMPRRAVVGAIVDHTAHHRGSLAVYARLLGCVPAMPYA